MRGASAKAIEPTSNITKPSANPNFGYTFDMNRFYFSLILLALQILANHEAIADGKVDCKKLIMKSAIKHANLQAVQRAVIEKKKQLNDLFSAVPKCSELNLNYFIERIRQFKEKTDWIKCCPDCKIKSSVAKGSKIPADKELYYCSGDDRQEKLKLTE